VYFRKENVVKKTWKFQFVAILAVLLVAVILFFPVLPAAALTESPPLAASPLTVVFTPEKLVGIGAVLLALLFDWLPGLAPWYDKLKDGQKRGLMAILLLLLSLGAFGMTCAGWIKTGWVCSGLGLLDPVYLWILSVVINQPFHGLTKP